MFLNLWYWLFFGGGLFVFCFVFWNHCMQTQSLNSFWWNMLHCVSQAVKQYHHLLLKSHGISSCLNYPIMKSTAPMSTGNLITFDESSFVVVSKSDLEGYESNGRSSRIWELGLVYRVQFAGQAALASLSCFWLQCHSPSDTAVLPSNKLGRESCSLEAEQPGFGRPCLVSSVVVNL